MERQCLMIPGPTPVPVGAALAGAQPMINHRGPEFGALLSEVTGSLARVLVTHGTVLVFPASGTGGMEASAVNLVSPGDKVLVAVAGEFGSRFAEILRVTGAQVSTIEVEWGTRVDPAAIRAALESDPAIRAVVVTHNETSTGVTMDLASIRRAIVREDVLFIVDAISSMGAIQLHQDEWGIDAVVGGSQKGLMTPPGLAMISLSPKAWDKVERTTRRSVYWDFMAARKFFERPTAQTPYTPAVSLLYSLRESLRMLESEGLENVYRRHRMLARAVRAGVRGIGLEPLAPDDCASSTVTAVKLPDGVDAKSLLSTLRKEYGVVIAGGQGSLSGRIIRIGHVGNVSWQEVVVSLSAIEMALAKLGRSVDRGASVAAAEEVFMARG